MTKNSRNENLGQYIAFNMKVYRREFALSQEQLSERSGIPRSTIASLERGEGNPTLQVLIGITHGLGVSMTQLVQQPEPKAVLYKKHQHTKSPRNLTDGFVKFDKTIDIIQLTSDNSRYLILQEYTLNGGEKFLGSPHPCGTEEYFYCYKGAFEILIDNELFIVEEEDLLCFDGHQKHSYGCKSAFKLSKGLSILVQIPKF